ncbi:MAG: Crp/Fnr family transcriptional regulator [Rhodoferax sp.]|uniref:Crp/Fnr family transcriptional regulator n=1 Tax=Rhodoferax sp. TaxID=50421 RepID=UPI0008C353EA|nr:Crp/Fnr family transcriptional regulator [Rhodoferax sp.]MDP2677181.1 Crp/Fnr family transcriptional regulator [Rhodoferax sp.]OGB50216.1 MAG: cyclic nucleotide-binding protein [Burkholderiales bacterium RIFOXYD12_FULL_59_19]OGB75997.1 MAG: cyclic nucleotide-binding protein [Burkholderiales bacterium RIFOXYC12_FULL_60_6]OGB84623.1 MAG: cyclic nucleotide-binding protein [Burkholderiales bacterium RIFOXYD2_FULL_59_8]
MIPIKTESAWRGTSDCRQCGIRAMVLFADLNEHDFGQIHAPIDDMEYAQGDALYAEATPAQGIFTLRSGMVKLVRSTVDGRQRIVRVLRAGDVIGLEALAGARYDSDAVALTPVTVCRIPLNVIQKLASGSPRLHTQLMHKWQRALKDADDWLADMNFGTARQRVTNLVLKMRSPINPDVSVLFSREDMGAMLDLKLETVSREISSLVRDGVIKQLDKQGRIYRVNQPAGLSVH